MQPTLAKWPWFSQATGTSSIDEEARHDLPMNPILKLGVNIDHVATLRQARYRTMPDAPNAEPSVLQAAEEAIAGGADSLTLHLRADRRHIQDADLILVMKSVRIPINMEMGNTPEILEIALGLRPAYVCLVPENREEVTTEGGLHVSAQEDSLRDTVQRLQSNGTSVSMFIDPDLEQVRASARIGARMIELHTGTFANRQGAERGQETRRLSEAAKLGHSLGLQINAGHGLTTANLPDLFSVPHLSELNIGHHLICRSVFIGLRSAVAEMRQVMNGYTS